MDSTVFYGAIINPQKRDTKKPICYDAWPRALLAFSKNGNITHFIPNVPESDLSETLTKNGLENAPLIPIPSNHLLMPGFIDTHTVCLPCT